MKKKNYNDHGGTMMLQADVLIPVYRPGNQLERLLERLKKQKYPIHRIILMNTEKQYFPEGLENRYGNTEVCHLAKAEFDHGGTRDRGMRMSRADVVICMTQDALPADTELIGRLLEPFSDPEVCAAYARQLPVSDCSEVEKYTRSFNYPDKSRIKGKQDLPELGVKAFFCSNVCAAWRREAYLEMGGFAKRTIFNEDMILAGQMIKSGKKIAYCADARVVHSHNYSAIQQFHRYFDLAVSQVMHPEVFGGVKSESEGIRLVKKSVLHFVREKKPWLILPVITQNAGKYVGYRAGRCYQRLPRRVILWCTMNPSFWQGEWS